MLISTFLNVSKISWLASSSLEVRLRNQLGKGGIGLKGSLFFSPISLVDRLDSLSKFG